MSFLEKIGLDFLANEVRWLTSIRDATELWYNELTDPIIPILIGDITKDSPKSKRKELSNIARTMFEHQSKVNQGDKVTNVLSEMSKSMGIPLFSGRNSLRKHVIRFLEAGDFVKSVAYGDFRASTSKKSVADAIARTKDSWREFREAKNDLVAQINSQIASIGKST